MTTCKLCKAVCEAETVPQSTEGFTVRKHTGNEKKEQNIFPDMDRGKKLCS